MTVEERGVTKASAKSCPCEACKKVRKEPSKITSMDIHSYNSRPYGGWRKQIAVSEARLAMTPKVYMGVELETTVKNHRDDIVTRVNREMPLPAQPDRNIVGRYSTEYNEWQMAVQRIEDARYTEQRRRWREIERGGATLPYATAQEAVSMAEPLGFWHPKHDGSVSGPEFASLPATLNYWYDIKPDLERMFTTLLHAGVRSHTGDHAGMHVSMSVESFTDSDHLLRFSRLVNTNASWTRRMSQRTAHSLHWSQIGYGFFSDNESVDNRTYGRGTNRQNHESWARRMMRDGQAEVPDRYVAINSPGDGRLEFRVPRGTLRIDRFYKNLEWVASMIDFSQNYGATDAATYMRWVQSQPLYPDLRSWIEEKFHIGTLPNFTPKAAPEPSASNVANAFDPASIVSSSLDSRYCACGDGCYRDQCANCDEQEEDFYEEEPESVCCSRCGQYHDMSEGYYHGFIYGYQRHFDTAGNRIGPRRYWQMVNGEVVELQYYSDTAEPTTPPPLSEVVPAWRQFSVPPVFVDRETVPVTSYDYSGVSAHLSPVSPTGRYLPNGQPIESYAYGAWDGGILLPHAYAPQPDESGSVWCHCGNSEDVPAHSYNARLLQSLRVIERTDERIVESMATAFVSSVDPSTF